MNMNSNINCHAIQAEVSTPIKVNTDEEPKKLDSMKEIGDDIPKPLPPNSLPLKVKHDTLPSTETVSMPAGGITPLKSPLTPPPKPPMLSRTRSTVSSNNEASSPSSSHRVTVEQNKSSKTAKIAPTELEQLPEPTISAKHYEGLIEELRCPGCAGAMKAPVLLCKSGHSICEQCTRILLMCPLCKESFTSSRSLTVEALCAKAHFRCGHATGGCTVRMPVALLPWHEEQCIYKPMKCFMGRVWGDCKWNGREIQWKEHLEDAHADKVFNSTSADLAWNMTTRSKPLTGYYVFQAYNEMFNFYEINDKQRVLFTMTCTSNRRTVKHNYAYEVTLFNLDNEALAMTQKFPVHSEYDRDILMDGTCVSIGMAELSRFIDDEKLLHYRVNVLTVKSPRKTKPVRLSVALPIDYQQTQIAGVNGKSVPANMIITRTYGEGVSISSKQSKTSVESDSEPEVETDLERKWGTPQLHFNRKYLRNSPNDIAGKVIAIDDLSPLASECKLRPNVDDKLSLCSNSNSISYSKKISNSLRKSFRAIKADIVELRPFTKKSPVSKRNSIINK